MPSRFHIHTLCITPQNSGTEFFLPSYALLRYAMPRHATPLRFDAHDYVITLLLRDMPSSLLLWLRYYAI